jgi:hypothetical protein
MTGVWRRAAGVVAAAGLAAALAGCSSDGMSALRLAPEDRPNVYPASYRADLVAALHTYLSDPANIRDAFVAEPLLASVGRQRRYTACVRFNARDSDGRYAGRVLLGVFSSGRFDQFFEVSASTDPASRETLSTLLKERCDTADYKRFPELEAMKR